MAGHSKWKQIKRQKAVVDAKRGAAFTKLGREITIAARAGGGDPDGNPRLRLAILKARDSNMPMDIINRAIEKAAGAQDMSQLEEVLYEGYGPGSTAVLIEAVTDNRNRTAADVRAAFNKGGGRLGESGSVAWQFTTRGVISIPLPDGADPEELALGAIDAGAEDFVVEEEVLSIYTKPDELYQVRQVMVDAGQEPESAEIERVPNNTIEVESGDAMQALRLLERLEDLDDVQKVYSNADFTDEVLAAYSS